MTEKASATLADSSAAGVIRALLDFRSVWTTHDLVALSRVPAPTIHRVVELPRARGTRHADRRRGRRRTRLDRTPPPLEPGLPLHPRKHDHPVAGGRRSRGTSRPHPRDSLAVRRHRHLRRTPLGTDDPGHHADRSTPPTPTRPPKPGTSSPPAPETSYSRLPQPTWSTPVPARHRPVSASQRRPRSSPTSSPAPPRPPPPQTHSSPGCKPTNSNGATEATCERAEPARLSESRWRLHASQTSDTDCAAKPEHRSLTQACGGRGSSLH